MARGILHSPLLLSACCLVLLGVPEAAAAHDRRGESVLHPDARRDQLKQLHRRRSGRLEEGGLGVEMLTAESFGRILVSPDTWMVAFLTPDCEACRQLQPTWEKLAAALEGRVRVATLDCSTHVGACTLFGVDSWPHVMRFGRRKARPEAYPGPLTLEALVAYATSPEPEERVEL